MTPPDDVLSRLEQIRKRTEAATEGPWVVEHKTDEADYNPPYVKRDATVPTLIAEFGPLGLEYDERNAEWIASARSDVPYLLSLVEEVVELLDGWERAYPTDIFPEPPERPDEARLVWVDPETGEQLSETFALGRVSAAMGRFMAAAFRRALRDAAQEGGAK